MSRLYLWIWLATVAIFTAATVAHEALAYLFWSDAEETASLLWVEGGYAMATARMEASADRVATLEELEGYFGIPIAIQPADSLSQIARSQLEDGSSLLYDYHPSGDRMISMLSTGEALVFGPYPPWPLPDIPSRLLLIAITAAGFAGAFRLLLRGLDRQHRALESAAGALAEGDLDARVPPDGPMPELAGAFNHMADRTGETLAAQRRLLRAVSHELRTPIARLRIGVHLLTLVEDPDERDARAADLDGDLQQLDDLVDELLTYARAEAGPQSADPDALTRQGVPLRAAGAAAIRGWALLREDVALELGPGLAARDLIVDAEPRLLRRALNNLVGNAARHAAGRVRLDAERRGDEILMWVEDDGPGVPADERERVFEPFVRLSDDGEGHGMGLAIVRQVMAWHGGRARIDASAWGGARVETWWPAT